MKWFTGSISEAISAAHQKQAIFVVVVTGDDDNSKELVARLDDPAVLSVFDNFVSIHLKNGSTESQQFSQLYPLVVIPSVYFIGLQGLPLEVIGGLTDVEGLKSRALKALGSHKGQSTAQQGTAESETASSAVASSVANVPQVISAQDENAGTASVAPDSPLEEPLDDRVKKAQEKLALLREKKAAEEREKEKQAEIQRRQLGRDLQKFETEKREREMREIAEQRNKEKQEEKLAREKVKQQIAQDRANRAAQYQAAKAEEEERKKAAIVAQQKLQEERAAAAAAARSAFARLQFRLPDGSTRTEQFEADVPLSRVLDFINNEIKPPFRPFSLFTTFPRREFQKTDMNSTLRELNLAPSAALLIVPTSSGSSLPTSSSTSGVSWFSWLLSPIWTFLAFLRSFVFAPAPLTQGPGNPAPSESAQQVQRQRPTNEPSVRRRFAGEGNVRRLRDNSGDDSDDNATWNGNSTQQL